MKPAPFAYRRATSVDDALEALVELGDDAKVLAGGQSLVPMLNFRLARPAALLDIGGLGELAYIRKADGRLRIGATTRHAAVERSMLIGRDWPLLRSAIGWVAHPAIRNAGTVGGSIAHADPAAELPLVCVALGAQLRLRSRRGDRVIPAAEFFVSHFTTVAEPDELLVEIELPPMPAGSGWGFAEFAVRHGDFGLAGAACVLTVDDAGRCTAASIVLLSVAPIPWRAAEAEAALVGRLVDDAAIDEAARVAAAGVEPTADFHGSTDYRRRLTGEMVRRALRDALDRTRPADGTDHRERS